MIIIGKPNCSRSSTGGMLFLTGFTTGIRYGVSISPRLVCRTPILPARSLSLASKLNQAHLKKKRGYVSLSGLCLMLDDVLVIYFLHTVNHWTCAFDPVYRDPDPVHHGHEACVLIMLDHVGE